MTVDTVVIGGGPAGLATSRELSRRSIDHVVLERGDCVGYSWANFYDSLVLHTGRHMSALPQLAYPPGTPLFPSRHDFVGYLQRYAETFRLPVRTNADVIQAERDGDAWRVRTRAGQVIQSRRIVVATGIASNPHVPEIPNRQAFRGSVRHSAEYKNPAGCADRRVLVVGAGNSAGEIAAELSRGGARVTLSVRSGAHVVPRDVFGVPIQYLTIPLGYLPRRLQRGVATFLGRGLAALKSKPVLPPPNPEGCVHVPIIGFGLANGIRQGVIHLKGGLASFTPEGARFVDGSESPFDDVILATGYRAALGMFEGRVRRDPCGFALRHGKVASADLPHLYFVGHNPDVRGGIFRIGQDARRVGRLIARDS